MQQDRSSTSRFIGLARLVEWSQEPDVQTTGSNHNSPISLTPWAHWLTIAEPEITATVLKHCKEPLWKSGFS